MTRCLIVGLFTGLVRVMIYLLRRGVDTVKRPPTLSYSRLSPPRIDDRVVGAFVFGSLALIGLSLLRFGRFQDANWWIVIVLVTPFCAATGITCGSLAWSAQPRRTPWMAMAGLFASYFVLCCWLLLLVKSFISGR